MEVLLQVKRAADAGGFNSGSVIIGFIGASLVTSDDSIVTDFTGWLKSVLAARGLPDGTVPLGVGVLRECLPEGLSEVDRLLTAMTAASAAGQ